MKYKYMIVGHPLLSYYDFLTSIDNEVATLVILAVLAILHSLELVEVGELTELGSQHDRNLANHHSGLLVLM
jgi:hypothetical protein